MTTDKPTETKTPQMTFEQALARIERIVEEMESGKVDLDAMIARYEEGQRLVAECQKRLTEMERRVEQLVKKADGTLAAEPFAEV